MGNISTHAVNLLYILVEFSISAISVRILHAYMIFIFGLVYSVFTVIYWQAGGTNKHDKNYIYSVLDYNKGPTKAAIWVVLMHIALVVIHSVWSGLYQLKLIVYRKNGWIREEEKSDYQGVQMSDLEEGDQKYQ